MASNVQFSEERLSTVLDGLIALVDTPPAVSRSLNLVVYAVAVPLDPPEDDPDAEPQFRQLIMANDKRLQRRREAVGRHRVGGRPLARR
jgi:hypothetical protein